MKLLKEFLVVLFLVISASPSLAQLGQFYIHTDSLAITTAAVDSVFARQWESVLIWSPDVDLLLKIGAPDTASWSSRKYCKVVIGNALAFGPSTKVRRVQYKAASGSGTIYFLGHKTGSQY